VDKTELDERFSELYRSHLRDVYSYAYYRVGNHHDAEDLTEQTFLQAYRHFPRALDESDGRPLRPWPTTSPPTSTATVRASRRRTSTRRRS
jgi:RNA polymerase sigma-70 factor, ECF subfamily